MKKKATAKKAPPKTKAPKPLKKTVASAPRPAAGAGVDPAFAPVVQAFAGARDVVGGRMMSSYGLKVNGKIFAMYGRGQFTVKLPARRVDELIAAGLGKRFDPGHGRLMKEWVTVGHGLADWPSLAREAYLYVKNL